MICSPSSRNTPTTYKTLEYLIEGVIGYIASLFRWWILSLLMRTSEALLYPIRVSATLTPILQESFRDPYCYFVQASHVYVSSAYKTDGRSEDLEIHLCSCVMILL